MKLASRALAWVLVLSTATFAADTWECKATGGGECTATIVTQNGAQVPVSLRRGQKLVRGEGQSVLLTSDNWNKVST